MWQCCVHGEDACYGRGRVRESCSFQLSSAALPAAMLAALFVVDAVSYMESLLLNAGSLLGHAADLLCSGQLCVFVTVHDIISSLWGSCPVDMITSGDSGGLACPGRAAAAFKDLDFGFFGGLRAWSPAAQPMPLDTAVRLMTVSCLLATYSYIGLWVFLLGTWTAQCADGSPFLDPGCFPGVIWKGMT